MQRMEQSRRTGRRIPKEAVRRKQIRRIKRRAKQIAVIAAAAAVVILIVFGLIKGVAKVVSALTDHTTSVTVVEASENKAAAQEEEPQQEIRQTIETPEEIEKRQIERYGCVIYGNEYGYPWNQMSQDWDDIDGFYYHEISDDAKQAGGEFPVIAQIYTYVVCRDAGVDYETVFALIEKESGFRYDCIGDSGESIGLMQINQRWHKDRMTSERATNLKNPYMNIRVGVSYLADLYEATGNTADMLTAYNYGLTGARENLWSRGIHDYPYNESIQERAAQLKAETAAAREAAQEGKDE